MSARLILVLTSATVLASPASAGLTGRVGGGLGATFPEGEFDRYTDTSFSLDAYGRLDVPPLPWLGVRIGFSWVLFDQETRDVLVGGFPYRETYSNDLTAVTLGLEASHEYGRFEPYMGGAWGVYVFASKTSLRDIYGDEVASHTLSSDTKLGWSAIAGLRFRALPRLSVDLNGHHHLVKDLEQYAGETPVSLDSEFSAFSIGVSYLWGELLPGED